MADKVTAGQAIPRSATTWNNILDSANDFAQRKRLGTGGAGSGSLVSTDIVKAKNATGGALVLGSVIELDGSIVTATDRNALWFSGDTPDGTRPFAVLLQDTPSNAIDRAQISGVCVALVSITATTDRFATVVSGATKLTSGAGGPVRILSQPASTGDQLCAVLLNSQADVIWETGKLDGEMTYQGTQTVSIWRWNGSAMVDSTENVTARDWLLSSGQTIASGKQVVIVRHPTGQWFVIGAQCA